MRTIEKILARAVDHYTVKEDGDSPKLPSLAPDLARAALYIKTFLVLINVITCGFVIANVIHKW